MHIICIAYIYVIHNIYSEYIIYKIYFIYIYECLSLCFVYYTHTLNECD